MLREHTEKEKVESQNDLTNIQIILKEKNTKDKADDNNR
jgi:hypothetical protein